MLKPKLIFYTFGSYGRNAVAFTVGRRFVVSGQGVWYTLAERKIQSTSPSGKLAFAVNGNLAQGL